MHIQAKTCSSYSLAHTREGDTHSLTLPLYTQKSVQVCSKDNLPKLPSPIIHGCSKKILCNYEQIANRRIKSFLIDLASELGNMRRNIMEKNTSHHRISCPGAAGEFYSLGQRTSIIEREEATLREH